MRTRGCSKVWSCSGARSDNGGFGGVEKSKIEIGRIRDQEVSPTEEGIETRRSLLLKRESRPGGLSYREREEDA